MSPSTVNEHEEDHFLPAEKEKGKGNRRERFCETMRTFLICRFSCALVKEMGEFIPPERLINGSRVNK